jgi:hypothetical protein
MLHVNKLCVLLVSSVLARNFVKPLLEECLLLILLLH